MMEVSTLQKNMGMQQDGLHVCMLCAADMDVHRVFSLRLTSRHSLSACLLLTMSVLQD